MGYLSTSIASPDNGQNGVVTISTVDTGTNSATDVLSTSDAKSYAKIETSVDDSLVASLVEEIIDTVETTYSFQLIEKTVTANYETFSNRVTLPLFPVQSVTSVKTINKSGVESTLTAGDDFYLEGDTLVFAKIHNYESPFNRIRLKVVYTAGFTSIPKGITLGLKKAVLSSYEDRQDLVEGGVSELPNGSKSFFKKYAKLV